MQLRVGGEWVRWVGRGGGEWEVQKKQQNSTDFGAAFWHSVVLEMLRE